MNQRVGVSQSVYDSLKKVSARKGVSVSHLANNVLEQVGIDLDSEKVILDVPKSLTRRNKEAMRQWLQVKMDAIVNVYYPEKR